MSSAGKTNRSIEDNYLLELAVTCTAGMLHLTQIPEHHSHGLFVGAQRFSRKDKHLILGMCLKTALADGNYSTNAKILIGKIAAWLGMNEHHFEIWQEESAPLRQAAE